MKCLSFQEPFATFIATGQKTIECRGRKVKTPIENLVVCASKTARMYDNIPGLLYGYAIGMVDVVDCVPFVSAHKKQAMMSELPDTDCYAWILENPRMIEPFPVHASAGFFYDETEPVLVETSESSYREHMLSLAYRGEREQEEDVIESLFGDPKLPWQIFDL